MKTRKTLLSIFIITVALLAAVWFNKGTFTTEQTVVQEVQTDQDNQQLTIGDTHYLFDVSDQNSGQIKELLNRAEQLSGSAPLEQSSTNIVMVIHGPNVVLFDQKNYQKNKELVDLAARLEAFNIIDFKICQTAATMRGIESNSFHSFLEVIPIAPTEINRLVKKGYVEL